MRASDPTTSRRERGKDTRRTRIVDAACALLREVDVGELSVRQIAERADLSPATVFNLFGSKAAVLVKVYERDLINFERRMSEQAGGDALDRMFEAVSVACDLIRADPRFYRSTMGARNAGLDQRSVLAAHRPRLAFWRRLVGEAIDEGHLARRASADRVAVLLVQILAGALLHWGAELISVEALALECGYGFAVTLLTFAQGEARARLEARLAACEAGLAAPEAARPIARLA